MTSSPASGSSSFDLLHPSVQRWVYRQHWEELRAIQEQAIPLVLAGEDVVLAAATAGGKTEAAFLPICSSLVDQPADGVQALQISPLKALINDQFGRLEALCDELDIRVTRWHGDVGEGPKRKLLAHPSGLLLITPESLEALFVNRGTQLARLFSDLRYVVVDELHDFIGTERGRQMQSLLHRLEVLVGQRVPRIGLSATLGELSLAGEYLRPGGGVRLIESEAGGQELKLLLRGYRAEPPPERPAEDAEDPTVLQIAGELFRSLRGRDHLVFANSRARVEQYADLLRRMCDDQRMPNEFFPHHGSLSAGLREDVERRLRDRSTPLTVVCTNTLELGIDIGDVTSIAQLGAPPTVASLRQRLGRSGRRAGQPAILRLFVEEAALDAKSEPRDLLREQLFQAVAMVELLLQGWCEPPVVRCLHLSTLVQQVLSLIAQYGGVTAAEAYRVLCAGGPFAGVEQSVFVQVLRCLGDKELLEQDRQGVLLLGRIGERLVNHYSFYTAFQTPEEYRLVHGQQTLGTLPVDYPLAPGAFLIFAGRRWLVREIDAAAKVIMVEPAQAGRVPHFGGGGRSVHDRVREEMRRLYTSTTTPSYLDGRAIELLAEGRDWFRRLALDTNSLATHGPRIWWFPWCGDRALNTLWLSLQANDADVRADGFALSFGGAGLSPTPQDRIRTLAKDGPVDALALARLVANKASEKHHVWLDDELLALDYAAARLDPRGAWQVANNHLV